MIDRQHSLPRPRVFLLALLALVAVRSLVEGASAASVSLVTAGLLTRDDHSGLVQAPRRDPMIDRVALASNNDETSNQTSHPGRPLTRTGSMATNRVSGDGSRTGDDVSVDSVLSNGKMESTGTRHELFDDGDDDDTGNGQQYEVELWNTSSLTELDLLPEELSYSASEPNGVCL